MTALVQYTRDVVYMEDGEVAVLSRDGIQVYNAMEQPIEKEHQPHRLGDLGGRKGRL